MAVGHGNIWAEGGCVVQSARSGCDVSEVAKPVWAQLLFLAPPPRTHGPIRAIAETLAESLGQEGYSIGSHRGDVDQIKRTVCGVVHLLQDTRRVREMVAEWQPDAVVLHTGSDWVRTSATCPSSSCCKWRGLASLPSSTVSQVRELSKPGTSPSRPCHDSSRDESPDYCFSIRRVWMSGARSNRVSVPPLCRTHSGPSRGPGR